MTQPHSDIGKLFLYVTFYFRQVTRGMKIYHIIEQRPYKQGSGVDRSGASFF